MTAHLAEIWRHPIKGHGREPLGAVTLAPGATLPWDRAWAVAHEAARLEPGAWAPCQNFARGAKAPALMAISAAFDEGAGRIHLRHPDLPDIAFAPDDPEDAARFIAWAAPLNPPDRARPVRLVRAAQPFTDTDFPSVAILSLASQRALGAHMGVALDVGRWRGNLWLDDLAPWEEMGMIGREIVIGPARLRVREPITRCRATMANPDTGRIDADTLAALEALTGAQDFGVYAEVVAGGRIARGDPVRWI
ncbi:MAG: MOSC domain-containing protein [Gemmobacter sp.]